ncbi:MAG: hypothetical protein WBC47_08515, partial [Dehalococcoidia bacterium]
MKNLKNVPSPRHVRSERILVSLGALLLTLACTCPLPPIVVNYPVTVISSPGPGMSGEDITTETATPTDSPAPTRTTIPTVTSTDLPAPQGGGEWGLTESDLEMVGVTETNIIGDIWLEIRNHGPHNFVETLRVFCTGGGILNEGVTLPLPPTDPVNTEDWFGLSIPTGGTA